MLGFGLVGLVVDCDPEGLGPESLGVIDVEDQAALMA
jgi:hypothetical protein